MFRSPKRFVIAMVACLSLSILGSIGIRLTGCFSFNTNMALSFVWGLFNGVGWMLWANS
jgi:hypothetical protein